MDEISGQLPGGYDRILKTRLSLAESNDHQGSNFRLVI
jgi:hypothetical protein